MIFQPRTGATVTACELRDIDDEFAALADLYTALLRERRLAHTPERIALVADGFAAHAAMSAQLYAVQEDMALAVEQGRELDELQRLGDEVPLEERHRRAVALRDGALALRARRSERRLQRQEDGLHRHAHQNRVVQSAVQVQARSGARRGGRARRRGVARRAQARASSSDGYGGSAEPSAPAHHRLDRLCHHHHLHLHHHHHVARDLGASVRS